MNEHRHFSDWTCVRDALKHAYSELGLQEERTPRGSQYNPTHWNIAGLVRDYVLTNRETVKCVSCQTRLNVHEVIRCLDCRSALCERCAPGHFGPKHQSRAALAHPAG